MSEVITIYDIRNSGFKSIGEAWDAYCEVNENYLGMGADTKFICQNKRFISWLKKMAADFCADCCDDSGFGYDNGEW